LKSPAQIEKALGDLNRVLDHTRRLIVAKKYNQLRRENDEFDDGSQALEKSIADEPTSFKMKIERMLQDAKKQSKDLADAATNPDPAKLATLHESLVSSVDELLLAFPGVQTPLPSLAEEQQEEQVETTGTAK